MTKCSVLISSHIQMSCLWRSHALCNFLFRMTLGKAAVRVVNLGRISYGQALQVQQKHVRQHLDKSSEVPNTLLLCEHHPVYTIGIRQAPYSAEEEEKLKSLGAEFFRTNRGGLITFHGPGQLVCYPVLNLGCFKKSVRWYVCELEKTVIGLCSKFGIKAATSPDTGVWVGDNKICAIGVLNCHFDYEKGKARICLLIVSSMLITDACVCAKHF